MSNADEAARLTKEDYRAGFERIFECIESHLNPALSEWRSFEEPSKFAASIKYVGLLVIALVFLVATIVFVENPSSTRGLSALLAAVLSLAMLLWASRKALPRMFRARYMLTDIASFLAPARENAAYELLAVPREYREAFVLNMECESKSLGKRTAMILGIISTFAAVLALSSTILAESVRGASLATIMFTIAGLSFLIFARTGEDEAEKAVSIVKRSLEIEEHETKMNSPGESDTE